MVLNIQRCDIYIGVISVKQFLPDGKYNRAVIVISDVTLPKHVIHLKETLVYKKSIGHAKKKKKKRRKRV